VANEVGSCPFQEDLGPTGNDSGKCQKSNEETKHLIPSLTTSLEDLDDDCSSGQSMHQDVHVALTQIIRSFRTDKCKGDILNRGQSRRWRG